jgi:hypothetical protein
MNSFTEVDMDDSYDQGLNKALDRIRYCQYSIVLRNDEYTQGYIAACKRIEQEIEKVKNGK